MPTSSKLQEPRGHGGGPTRGLLGFDARRRGKVAAPTSASAHTGSFDGAVVADYYRGQSSGQPSHSVSSRALIIAALLLAMATAGPPADARQTPRLARIGLLLQATPTATAHLSEAFRQGVRDLGYVEAKSFVLELRYGEGSTVRVPHLAGGP